MASNIGLMTMRKEVDKASLPGRHCESGFGANSRAATSKSQVNEPISPPVSSQPPTQPNSPEHPHSVEPQGQLSQAEISTEAGRITNGTRETNPKPLTPREKVELLKICYKYGYGILHAPMRNKRSEDESYQPVLEEFSTKVRPGFFKTCAEVNTEVKNICRSRRKRTKGGVAPAKRSQEPEYDASVDQWVHVWNCRTLMADIAKVNHSMQEILGPEEFKRILPPRLAGDELPEDLSDLILDAPVRTAYRRYISAVVRPWRADDQHSPKSSTSDESSPDSSDEEDWSDELSTTNGSLAPLRSIEYDFGLAPSPASLDEAPEPSPETMDLQPTQPPEELLDVLGEFEKRAISILEKAKQDGKGKDVSIRGLERPDAEQEQQLSLTLISRSGNGAENPPGVDSLVARTNTPHDLQPQSSLTFSIRPLSAIMNAPLDATPSTTETTKLSDLVNPSGAGSNKPRLNGNSIADIDDAGKHLTPTPVAPWVTDTQGVLVSRVASRGRAPVSSGSCLLDRGNSRPETTQRSKAPALRRSANKKQASKRHRPVTPKVPHRSAPPKKSSSKHPRTGQTEIRPSVFYGSSCVREEAPDQSQSLPREWPNDTSRLSIPDPYDTPTSSPRRPFKYHLDSNLRDRDLPWTNLEPASSSTIVQSGHSYDDSDSESFPDVEELSRRHTAGNINIATGSTYAVSVGERRQEPKATGLPSQQNSTRDENQSIERRDSPEANRDVPSSAVKNRHLSEQSVNKLPPPKPETPKSHIDGRRRRAGHVTSPNKSLTLHDCTILERPGYQKGRVLAGQSGSQARKRKKSTHPSSQCQENVNPLVSPMSVRISSPTPDHRPRKRQRQLLGANKNTPALPVANNSPPKGDVRKPSRDPIHGRRHGLSPSIDSHKATSDFTARITNKGHYGSRLDGPFTTPTKQISTSMTSTPASSNLFVSSGSMAPDAWRTKGWQRGSKSRHRQRLGQEAFKRAARETTANTTDFEQFSPDKKCNFLHNQNKQLEGKLREMQQTLRLLGKGAPRA